MVTNFKLNIDKSFDKKWKKWELELCQEQSLYSRYEYFLEKNLTFSSNIFHPISSD